MNTTHYTIPLDHPAFAGHFPGSPILPGVVLLDLALQAIADANNIVLNQCTLNSVKFIYPARPGDMLTITHKHTDSGAIHFSISTASHQIASGSMTLTP
jgi:3-hydroxymyristoyl/3-hydroxydecanoyl-(acyl carrier protein) dehydratase